MMRKIKLLFLFFLVIILFLSGCAHVISREARKFAASNIPFQWIAENPERYKGILVIWGGQIIETRNVEEGTQIIVLQKYLGYSEEPMMESNSGGRFLVLYKGFLDPFIYAEGEIITVAGIIEGEKMLPLYEIEYSYPYINAKEIYLWKRDELSQWCHY